MQKDMQHKLTRLLYELNALDKGPIQLSALALEVGVTVRTPATRYERHTGSAIPALEPGPRRVCVCGRVFIRENETFRRGGVPAGINE